MAFINKSSFKIYNKCKFSYTKPMESLGDFFEVDDILAPSISRLNIKGYTTLSCCQGHPYLDIEDTMVRVKENESLNDVVDGDIYASSSISNTLKYVLYEKPSKMRTYIMFEEGVVLPGLPKGWTIDKNYSNFTIEKVYNNIASYPSFYNELNNAIKELNDFIKIIDPFFFSPDNVWNEMIIELSNRIPDITDVECDLIREYYSKGFSVDKIYDKLIDTRPKLQDTEDLSEE